jgi:hypothetical protein
MNIGGMSAHNPSWKEFLKVAVSGTFGSYAVIWCLMAGIHIKNRH